MHNYIDCNKLKDFSKKKSFDDVVEDVSVKYKITNILEDEPFNEYLYGICEALFVDYDREIANYEAYIEPNMNARMLMELRRNAIIKVDQEFYFFYRDHCTCETIEDIRNLRIDFIKRFNEDYKDLNWQYYLLMKQLLGKKGEGFCFDFEECYADGDYRLQTNPNDYRRDFVELLANSLIEQGAGIR